MKQLEFEVLEGLGKEYMPSCQTMKSVGLDVRTTKGFTLERFESIQVGIGVKIKSIPDNLFLDLEVRSGKRFNARLSTLGTGIIDTDFTDEMKMLIYNFGSNDITIEKGERIGQLIVKENLTQKYASKYCLANVRAGGIGSTDDV